jgi:phage repressor protein C with HTH and peptisase S24 domain
LNGGIPMSRPPKQSRLLTHGQVWAALDRLAERAGLSPSGLARRAGLDPTTFNKSKRITADGRERWPSTESVAKALAATNASVDTFVQLIGDGGGRGPSVPLIGLAEAAASDAFDDNGFPTGKGWDEVALPAIPDEHAYALEISGETLRPAFRDGDVILVSPSTAIRRGDRVVVRTKSGETLVKECKRRTAKALELQSLNPAEADRTLAAEDVAWIARIVWVRQ